VVGRRAAVVSAMVVLGTVGAGIADKAADAQRAKFAERFREIWGARIESALAGATPVALPEHPELPKDVKDGVFGYLVGLLDANTYGRVAGSQFRDVLQRTGRGSRIPYETIGEVCRAPASTLGEGWVRVNFTGPLDVPVPYSILGYHPGSLHSSAQVTVREWRMPRSVISDPAGDVTGGLEVKDLTLWAIVEGRVVIDIDKLVDKLLGGSLDDTYMVGVAFFRFRGAAYAMALGYNGQGEPRSGALELAENEILFPTPRELKATARDLRARVVRHLAEMGLPAWLPE
jgi:hypothetical protein